MVYIAIAIGIVSQESILYLSWIEYVHGLQEVFSESFRRIKKEC
ncbi:hypothetical protein VCSRO113_2959 [Vibrio cholerae]|nr:hypothetical protein VCSRO162_3154 [Vibrio cholerae]GHY25975.1 hypothetical protein VCSRO113_2959 [Vibrio cholerae]GHZ22051.1 hypothetical protein VCSRO78_3561 [Vibrio cholerae]GIB49308.1 hypothetical protein VCSRO92_3414 [Vibrio cholerae]